MIARATFIASLLFSLVVLPLPAQEQAKEPANAAPPAKPSPSARSLTLDEAVQLALKNNHTVHLAALKVEQLQHEKDVARSYYYPVLKNDSSVRHITNLEDIVVPAGAFGVISGTAIPAQPTAIGQGSLNIEASRTSLTQPLTPLLKIREKNNIAAADLNSSRADARQTQNEIALRTRQLYYGVLLAQSHRDAIQAGIQAAEELDKERIQQVKFGSALTEEQIESRAQTLQEKQDLISIDLQLTDLSMQLNDLLGLPLDTVLSLDPALPNRAEPCSLEDCRQLAVASHPEIQKAQQDVEKASAGVRFAKRDYIPDTEVFAHYDYQNGIPFLQHNFGTFGFNLSYDIFDGGRKHATLEANKTQLAEARENLARVKDDIEVRVETAYNKLERTRQMITVSEQLLALRTESRRVTVQQQQQGAALASQAAAATARELAAKASLLQARLDFVQAQDELTVALGRTPQ
jgi:outer membrane protein TolC